MLLRRDRAWTAVAIVVDVAFHASRTGAASAADIAVRLSLARRGIEPVLQALTRAGVLEGLRGSRGGYRLARPRRGLRLLDVVNAVEEAASPEDCAPGSLNAVVLAPFWGEVDAAARLCLAQTTVEELLKRAEAAGLRRPSPPIDYVI